MKNKKSISEIDEILDSDIFKEQKKLIEERRKTIKKGPNVIHLDYYGELSSKDLGQIQSKLEEANLDLGYFDRSGRMTNNFDDFLLTTYFVLNHPLTNEILKSIGTSMIWDSIKWGIKFAWKKLRNMKISKVSSTTIEEKSIKFGMKVILDQNTSFNFELDGNIEEEQLDRVLDKAFDFLREQGVNSKMKNSDYVCFSHEENKWIRVDVLKEIQKRAKRK
ncbi:MAG: hypothetical protein PHE33_10035 [Bacteroidales bacterium]|nr:hypothetical protein [Bacteroidales bacterium]